LLSNAIIDAIAFFSMRKLVDLKNLSPFTLHKNHMHSRFQDYRFQQNC